MTSAIFASNVFTGTETLHDQTITFDKGIILNIENGKKENISKQYKNLSAA